MYSKRVVIPTTDNDKDIITYIYEQVFYFEKASASSSYSFTWSTLCLQYLLHCVHPPGGAAGGGYWDRGMCLEPHVFTVN